MRNLVKQYKKKKDAIRNRIKDFERVKQQPQERLFEELCFCICTPQSKAVLADKAVKELKRTKSLFKGNTGCVRKCLRGVRFPNNKARFIREARNIKLSDILKNEDDFAVREEIVKNVKGIGFKEASHFLRNIGRAKKLAILDVHILKNLKQLGVIRDIPKALSKRAYLDIEKRMTEFSEDIRISMRELDILFWANETGFIFK